MKYHFEEIEMCKEGLEIDNQLSKEILQYAVGALLYTPATHPKIVETLLNNTYPDLKSWAFCLEDSLTDQVAQAAVGQLVDSLKELAQAVQSGLCPKERLPLIFIRVRCAEQIDTLFNALREIDWLLCGFIAPKFERSNMLKYSQALQRINHLSSHPLYLMPILESQAIIYKESRLAELLAIQEALSEVQEWILNVRVGGNDFCNLFGLRRGIDQSVYDMGVIKDVLMDIFNVFGRDYVVSAPVWEYFGLEKDGAWQKGLEQELKADRLNGFIGKTAVHPTQLLPIQQALIVEEADYLDASQVLHWENDRLGVCKGVQLERMNEKRVHHTWARKIMALAEVYGVQRKSNNG